MQNCIAKRQNSVVSLEHQDGSGPSFHKTLCPVQSQQFQGRNQQLSSIVDVFHEFIKAAIEAHTFFRIILHVQFLPVRFQRPFFHALDIPALCFAMAFSENSAALKLNFAFDVVIFVLGFGVPDLDGHKCH